MRTYNKKQVLTKITTWCARREHTKHEARDKLYSLMEAPLGPPACPDAIGEGGKGDGKVPGFRRASTGLQNSEVEEIIDGLVKDDFINEKRFVKAYVNDKFRLNKWGKIKIEHGLKLKGISSELINKGLKQIDEKEYLNALAELIDKKKEKKPGAGRRSKHSRGSGEQRAGSSSMLNKLTRFAISRGFEAELVWEKVNMLMEDV